MAPFRYKTLLVKLLIAVVAALLVTPFFMYFSDDVAKLADGYPEESQSGLTNQKPRHWVDLNEISNFGKWAIILSEDWAFYQHDGIDINQMKVAFSEMVDERRFRGASTITQQMVKNVFLSNNRTLWRKIHEIILAQKVEKVLSKARILEVYLNVIEFGPDIYGIKKASFHYFKKHPSSLTPKEGAFLAMLLPSPKRYYVSFKKKKLTPFAKKRVESILIKMRMRKIISSEDFNLQMNTKLNWER